MIALQDDTSSSMTIGVADEHIGLVVGRGGRNLMDISQVGMLVFIFLFSLFGCRLFPSFYAA